MSKPITVAELRTALAGAPDTALVLVHLPDYDHGRDLNADIEPYTIYEVRPPDADCQHVVLVTEPE